MNNLDNHFNSGMNGGFRVQHDAEGITQGITQGITPDPERYAGNTLLLGVTPATHVGCTGPCCMPELYKPGMPKHNGPEAVRFTGKTVNDTDKLSTASLISFLWNRLVETENERDIARSHHQNLKDEWEMLSNPYQKLLNTRAYVFHERLPWDEGTISAIYSLNKAINMFEIDSKHKAANKYLCE